MENVYNYTQKDNNDKVKSPAHYTQHPTGIECIDVAEHFGFRLGNAIKYIWRCNDKGSKVQDLQKAIWYIEREIQKFKDERNENPLR